MDTNVVIYFLEGNTKFGDQSRQIFSIIERGEAKGFISVVSVAEILVKPMEEGNKRLVGRIMGFFDTFPNLHVVDINKVVATEAAGIRSNTGLKMRDALIIASAKVMECVIVGTDRKWNNKDLGVRFYALV